MDDYGCTWEPGPDPSHAGEITQHFVYFVEDEGLELGAVKAWYKGLGLRAILERECSLSPEIADFIRRYPSQRHAALRSLKAEMGLESAILVQLLAMMGAARAAELVEWRIHARTTIADLYLHTLAATTWLATYDRSRNLSLPGYEWPHERFLEIGYDVADDEAAGTG